MIGHGHGHGHGAGGDDGQRNREEDITEVYRRTCERRDAETQSADAEPRRRRG